MKKFLFLITAVMLISGLLISGCATPAATTPAATTPAATTPAATTPAATTPAATTPAATTPAATTPAATTPAGPTPPDPGAVYGGTFTIIENILTNNVGYPPEFGSQEGATATIWAEPLAELGDNFEDLNPFLATSWEEDPQAMTFTVHLRQGVKFQDGTDFNAEAARWNFQLAIDHKNIPLWHAITSIEVLDDYTLKFNLNDYPYNTKYTLLMQTFYSPTAIETNGPEWARDHAVATGPFKVVEFERDVQVVCEKFDGYWQKGYPYLDKVIFKRVGDPLVAQAMMEAGEADSWEAMADPTPTVEMAKRGFKAYYTGRPVNGLQWYLYREVKPDSIFNDIKVRQAIAHAIDNEGIALAIGKGIYDPLRQLVPPGLYGYNPDYEGYPYDPDKAIELLAEAGYPDGFSTQLVYEVPSKDIATIIRDNLLAVGIDAELVGVTDNVWFPMIFGMGWDGLNLAFSGVGNDKYCIASFDSWLGPNRAIPFVLPDWPQNVLDLLDEGLHTYDDETRKVVARNLITAATEYLNVIPIFQRPIAALNQAWVHSEHPEKGGLGTGRRIYKVWMDPH
jgi:peptide/nickel transport system substrate-binding protein